MLDVQTVFRDERWISKAGRCKKRGSLDQVRRYSNREWMLDVQDAVG